MKLASFSLKGRSRRGTTNFPNRSLSVFSVTLNFSSVSVLTRGLWRVVLQGMVRGVTGCGVRCEVLQGVV